MQRIEIAPDDLAALAEAKAVFSNERPTEAVVFRDMESGLRIAVCLVKRQVERVLQYVAVIALVQDKSPTHFGLYGTVAVGPQCETASLAIRGLIMRDNFSPVLEVTLRRAGIYEAFTETGAILLLQTVSMEGIAATAPAASNGSSDGGGSDEFRLYTEC